MTTASICAGHLVVEFARGGFVVEVGIVLVLELSGDERIRRLRGSLLHVADGTHHAFRLRSAHHLCAECFHERDFLDRETFRHREHGLVTATRSDQRESHAGVTGCGLENGCAGFQSARLLRLRDHAQSGAIFDAAARVQVLELGIDVGCIARCDFSKMKDWSFADQFGDVLGDPQGSHLSSLHEYLGR